MAKQLLEEAVPVEKETMNAGVNTVRRTPSVPDRPAPPRRKGPGAAFRPAPLDHKGQKQGIRFPGRDYRQPAFYMITMTAHERRPRFATCADNRSTLTEDGRLVYDLWHRMAMDYPQISLSTLVIMPDHLHGIVRVTEPMDIPVGVPLRAFKSQVTSAFRKRYANPDLKIWAPGYHDWAVWQRGSLNAYIHYIRDNPRRYCLRKAYPDLFHRVNNLHHPRLPKGETWTGYGNLFLLDKPDLHALRVSRTISPEKREAARSAVLEWVELGGVIVSPFISPGEKDIARAALDAGGAVILMKPDGFNSFFKPYGKYFDLCVQGRLLILSCRPPLSSTAPLTRDRCLAMNRWCTTIASS